tara:strand:+ start:6191 stop:6370 length:180 start_codon:yes stop_codon:yes gene_type:complete
MTAKNGVTQSRRPIVVSNVTPFIHMLNAKTPLSVSNKSTYRFDFATREPTNVLEKNACE